MRGEAAVRRAQWKLVQNPSALPELYDLSRDLGESNDLSESQPQIVDELAEALAAWELDVDGNPR